MSETSDDRRPFYNFFVTMAWGSGLVGIEEVAAGRYRNSVALWVMSLILFAVMRGKPTEWLPGIKGQIQQAVVGPLDQHTAYLLMTVKLRNTGRPTIVDRYRLTFTAQDGAVWHGLPMTIPPEGLTFPMTQGLPRQIASADSLVERTAYAPIPRGGAQAGLLLFALSNLPSVDTQNRPLMDT